MDMGRRYPEQVAERPNATGEAPEDAAAPKVRPIEARAVIETGN
jgi:hypothetical protein